MALNFPACTAAAGVPITEVPPATATEPSPTATIVWFPVTATPTMLPFPTLGPTPEQKPGIGALVLADDFSSAKPWNPAVSEDASVAVSQNRLTLAAQPGINAFRVRQGPTLANFYAEITARPSLCRAGDEYGLLFRAPSNAAFYTFTLSCDGTTSAERVRLGKPTPLHPPISSADVPPGAPGEVRLGVWMSGPEMRFFLNGRYQFRASDPTLKSGALGVFAHATAATPVTVIFSDLSVYAVTYAVPTATPLP